MIYNTEFVEMNSITELRIANRVKDIQMKDWYAFVERCLPAKDQYIVLHEFTKQMVILDLIKLLPSPAWFLTSNVELITDVSELDECFTSVKSYELKDLQDALLKYNSIYSVIPVRSANSEFTINLEYQVTGVLNEI